MREGMMREGNNERGGDVREEVMREGSFCESR